jgi:hypothetical protein
MSQSSRIALEGGKQLDFGQQIPLVVNTAFGIGGIRLQVMKIETDGQRLQLRCTHCQRLVEATRTDCPWCGTSLAFAETIILR